MTNLPLLRTPLSSTSRATLFITEGPPSAIWPTFPARRAREGRTGRPPPAWPALPAQREREGRTGRPPLVWPALGEGGADEVAAAAWPAR